MKRRRLLEIHEQPWCPQPVRDGATDCLRLIALIGRQFHGVAPLLQHALQRTKSAQIVDLCSGGGGPWLALHDQLHTADGAAVTITLTDLFPNRQALQAAASRAPNQVRYVAAPVDATAVPQHLVGLRTLFTAFHHFDPPVAQAILQDAVDAGQGIAVFEQTHRSPFAQLFMVILAPIAFLAIPLIRPFRWSLLFWTYFVPAIPAVLLFDGIVSCWRTYSETDLRAMTDDLQGSRYVWEIGRVRSLLSPLGIGYLIGYPAAEPTGASERTGDAIEPRVARTK